jgi:hypothetical protein
MNEYNLTAHTTLPSLPAQEAKEKRRKVLEAVRERRKVNYQRFREKIKKAYPDLDEQTID